MSNTSSDLIAFMRARLDEDEATARHAASQFGDRWIAEGEDLVRGSIEYVDVIDAPGAPVAHIAHHDPARVLREVQAKRQLLDRCEELRAHARASGLVVGDAEEYQDVVLPILALSYADDPDYRQEWKP